MTAPRECRPPEGTPDGTVFWMQHKDTGVQFRAMWRASTRDWVSQNGYWATPSGAWLQGWRIAEPPHD